VDNVPPSCLLHRWTTAVDGIGDCRHALGFKMVGDPLNSRFAWHRGLYPPAINHLRGALPHTPLKWGSAPEAREIA
jgi:hypothetical protein